MASDAKGFMDKLSNQNALIALLNSGISAGLEPGAAIGRNSSGGFDVVPLPGDRTQNTNCTFVPRGGWSLSNLASYLPSGDSLYAYAHGHLYNNDDVEYCGSDTTTSIIMQGPSADDETVVLTDSLTGYIVDQRNFYRVDYANPYGAPFQWDRHAGKCATADY